MTDLEPTTDTPSPASTIPIPLNAFPSLVAFLEQYRLACERDCVIVLAERAKAFSPEAAAWLLDQIAGHPKAGK